MTTLFFFSSFANLRTPLNIRASISIVTTKSQMEQKSRKQCRVFSTTHHVPLSELVQLPMHITPLVGYKRVFPDCVVISYLFPVVCHTAIFSTRVHRWLTFRNLKPEVEHRPKPRLQITWNDLNCRRIFLPCLSKQKCRRAFFSSICHLCPSTYVFCYILDEMKWWELKHD